MRKIYLLLLMLLPFSVACYSQDFKTTLDYQYKREGDSYSAYTAYLDSEQNAINLILATNQKIDEIQAIKIKIGKSFLNIPFTKITTNFINDDEAIQSLAVKLDLTKLKVKNSCETIITFQCVNGYKVELPFFPCKLKENLKP